MQDEEEQQDDFSRDLLGASVRFNDHGHVIKVSLPADFSLARITGLAPNTKPEDLADILRNYGFNVGLQCIRISAPDESQTTALVKVEDPGFAKRLSDTVKTTDIPFQATQIAINPLSTDCRKIHVSWHRASRTVWLNFGNKEIANRVAQKINERKYRRLDPVITASSPLKGPSRGRGGSHNPMAWTVMLNDVPGHDTRDNLEAAIEAPHEKPRHVEMGLVSYQTSNPDVSVKVRSLLEDRGPLESFYLLPMSENRGKRVKVGACFQNEADAKSACSLDNTPLTILGGGKLTVTLWHSAKAKVPTAVYQARRQTIEEQGKEWRVRHLSVKMYPGEVCTTLKVEGDNEQEVSNARKVLKQIFTGTVLMQGDKVIWHTVLNSNGSAYQKLRSVEKELQVAIQRIRSKHQLLFYGPPEKLNVTVQKLTHMLKDESSSMYAIDLKPHQFSWMIRGGYTSIEKELGKHIAGLDIVQKRLTVTGTEQQYERALAMMDERQETNTHSPSEEPTDLGETCPICFCEAENAVRTSCRHSYCLECLEDYCRSAASASKAEVQIKCHGDGGACSNIFKLQELKELLSSTLFEGILDSSFQQYVQRHPETLHYCPTPECGFVYRCAEPGLKPQAHTCHNCLETICTSCHVAHGQYTCAEYKDIASGGYEALRKLKHELNIKDCPKCTTPMEKTEGCNHMTCGGCKAHICWVCLAVFETQGPCYKHMSEVHGSWGI